MILRTDQNAVFCSKRLPWSGGIPTGYGSHGHDWTDSDFHFCSRKCAAKYQFRNLDDYPATKSHLESGGTFSKLTGGSKLACWIESRRTALIKGGKPDDKCYLYATLTESGKFKFGITTNPGLRFKLSGMVDHYVSPLIIKELTRLDAANLEADIKYRLNSVSEYIESSRIQEFNSILNELIGTDHPSILTSTTIS